MVAVVVVALELELGYLSYREQLTTLQLALVVLLGLMGLILFFLA
jgi:hypothetical protein